MPTARRLSAFARALLPGATLSLALVPAALLGPGAAPAAAQFAPTDLLLSAPGVGAIWQADPLGGTGGQLVDGMLIPHYGWFGPDGNFYVPDRGWVSILRITPAGEVSVLTAGGNFYMPVTCIPTLDGAAWLVSDMATNRIVRVGFDGSQTVIHDAASTGGLLFGPDGMGFDPDGNLYVANLGNDTLIRIDPQGAATLFSDADIIAQPGGVAVDRAGNLFAANYATGTIVRFRLDTGEGEVFAGPEFDKVIHPNDLKLSRSGGLITCGRVGSVVRIDALGQMEVAFQDLSLGELDGVSAPEDATLCSGSFTIYGGGQAGSGGAVPQLRAIFSPCPGQLIGLELLDFLGGAPAVMSVGSAALPPGAATLKGADLLVDPAGAVFLPIPLVLPGAGAGHGDLVLQFEVPLVPGLAGIELFHQVFAADPGAQHGLSASNGLAELFGT